MMRAAFLRRVLGILVLLVGAYSSLWAQTAGSGALASMEAKVLAIDENNESVVELNRKHLASYEAEANRLQALKDELTALEQRKADQKEVVQKRLDALLHEIEHSQDWKNRLASAQSGWKEKSPGTCGRGGPPPLCPVDHWYRVAVSVSMAEYEAYKNEAINAIKKYLDKFDSDIERKKEEIAKFAGGENEFAALREECDRKMVPLQASNDDLRAEIVALSKSYKESVVAEAKAMQSGWISDLMRLVAEKHFLEDRIDILKVKANDLAMEEEKALNEAKEKVRKQNDADIAQLNAQIHANAARATAMEQSFQQSRVLPTQQLTLYGTRLAELERILSKPASLTPSELQQLKAEQTDLTAKRAAAQHQLTTLTTAFLAERETLASHTKQCQDKKWALTTNLPNRLEQALAGLKSAFSTKRQLLADALVARRASLEAKGDLLVLRKSEYRAKFLTYASKVEAERKRLLGACSKSGASCFGVDTEGTIVLHWNNASGCVAQMEARHGGGTYYGCVEEAAQYKSHYNNSMDGLTDQEQDALSRRQTRTKYNMIYREVID